MKKFLHTLILTLLLAPAIMHAGDILDSIASAISSGDAAQVSNYFDANVNITVMDKQSVYSKSQAQMVVQDFFTKNPVKKFALIHRGSSAQGSSYGIGNLESGAKSYRVYFFAKLKNGSYYIQEMRFEKQK